MSKARTLADFISDGSEFADGTISVAEVSGAAPLASPTFTGNVDLGDNVQIRLGNDNDLRLYHDNATGNSYIWEQGTGGELWVLGTDIRFANTNFSSNYARFVDGGEVELYYGNQVKLETAADGVDITGDVGATTATITGKTTTDELDLNAIAATISDTAVDIFVYDTRKDSDGGVWRKRTQHTSWYNETLNTATRGSRKEFPAVAVIVVQESQTGTLTIYDGDDPDMPMWMVFNGVSDSSVPMLRTGVTSVTMMNGQLAIGHGGGSNNNRLGLINFITEDATVYYANGNPQHWKSDIKARNRTGSDSGYQSQSGLDIINRYVSDVAITILPNAPIDATTGLPVPTIAVATNGGVSVIKDDGTVVDITGVDTNHVAFYDSNSRLVIRENGNACSYGTIPNSDATWTSWREGFFNETTTFPSTLDQTNSGLYSNGEYDLGVTSGSGLSLIKVNPNDQATSTGAYITSSYNTGWMNGDIKLATLSDTDATNVTGDITPDTANFYGVRGGSVSESSGTVTVTSGNTLSWNGATINVTGLEDGKQYIAQLTVTGGSFGTGGWYFGKTANADGSHSSLVWGNRDVSSMGTAEALQNGYTQFVMFTAAGTNDYLIVENNTAVTGETITFNNFSVRKVEEDRSVNGNGLQVFGTVTKSAVATGADLVSSGGFNGTSIYLQQPYNSDLDFGTGDFSVMGWFKTADESTARCIVSRYQVVSNTDYTGFNITVFTDGTLYLYTKYANSITNSPTTGQRALDDNTWHHFVANRHSSGLIQIYVDGALYNNTSGGAVRDISVATDQDPLRIGAMPRFNQDGPDNLALLRISGTIPSPEQIKKIYEDEKVLFQEGAQATLYGSSDAVTALAYDDSTNLLHVGTSAGRSVFQGLRRVDNTTTAVGAAISASNGLVADE